MTHLPPTLNLNGHPLQRSGAGRTNGTHQYLDMAWGRTHELHLGQVDVTGPFYSMVAITGNSALRRVKVDHSTLQGNSTLRVGDEVLVEVQWAEGQLPQAKHAWRLSAGAPRPAQATAAPRPATGGRPAPRPILLPQDHPAPTQAAAPVPRHRGTLMELNGNYGYLIEEGSGNRVGIHRHQVLNLELPFRPGTRVSYRRSQNGQGFCAAEVKAA